MKALIIYTSQTGFTKKYAEILKEKISADILTIDEAKKQNKDFFEKYDTLIYGGWLNAGNVVKAKWFLDKADSDWKNKKLAVFTVGASPENGSDVERSLNKLLNDEQRKYIKAFYCPGGIDYSKMNMPSRLAMKAFAAMLKKNKNADEEAKQTAQMLENSFDLSDEKYLDPLIEYLEK